MRYFLLRFFNILNENSQKEGVISLHQKTAEVDYFYNETSEATPFISNIVQTNYQEVEIRE